MKRRVILLTVLALVGASLAVAQVKPPTDVTAPPAAPDGAAHFSHQRHAGRGVDVTACTTCHSLDATGQVRAPAALGHAPCLDAKCHASTFLAAGKAGAPATAQAFCLGCHTGVPSPWQHAAPRVLTGFRNSREHHVELNHYQHTQATECRTCHVVDASTFALVTGTPGHAQCGTCHGVTPGIHAMADCAKCHRSGSRATYLATELAKRLPPEKAAGFVSRPDTDVRVCNSEGALAHAAKQKHAIGCFVHERVGHRTGADGKPVQCAECHYIVAKDATHYRDLVDLQIQPIIDNTKDRQHAACGRSGCHTADVDQVRGGNCHLCHAEKSIF